MTDIKEQVTQIAADVLGVSTKDITPQSSPETLADWDSVRHVVLVLSLEENFAIHVSPEESAKMQTIEQIVKVVETKLAK